MLSSRKYLRYTMRYMLDHQMVKIGECCLRLCRSRRNNVPSRTIRTSYASATKTQVEENEGNINGISDEVRRKLIFSEYLDGEKIKVGYCRHKIAEDINRKQKQQRNFIQQIKSPVSSIALEQMLGEKNMQKPNDTPDSVEEDSMSKPIQMPYSSTIKYDTVETEANDIDEISSSVSNESTGLNEEYRILYEKFLESSAAGSKSSVEHLKALSEDMESNFQLADNLSKVPTDWMTDYEQYDDSLDNDNWQLNYGTPQPDSEVSAIPCGGCGALLHCKDSAIPGYLPSELFLGKLKGDLNSMTCQRCHFMKTYNTSLAVNVSADEYPKLLASIKNKKAAVILLVDLMDFPCSIWPDILSIIGTQRPVFVVGNKVDLLPQDSKKFLEHVTECLSKAIVETGVNKANIKHIALISAKTGFGVEQLINKLHNIWEYKGHVYLIGCTNSGKSTLFNALLQSDYCKSQAIDVIQRATTSPWPGTTLNLLKFPILRPSGWRLSQRAKRLREHQAYVHIEEKSRREKLNRTHNLKYAQLIGYIGRTFRSDEAVEAKDLYAAGSGRDIRQNKLGIDIDSQDYINSHWCYDTPGTIQPDQVLHLLTTDELMLTLPKYMITPRTFCLQPGHTLFLGGLGRLDFEGGSRFIRVTVFASTDLPVTICYTDDADFIYDQLLTTEVFAVPINDPERLKQWPKLRNKDFEIPGFERDVSAADIVLSSAGWLAITPGPESKANLRAWTPEGRGIYLRVPALLPHSVKLRGRRVRDAPSYYRGAAVYKRPN